MTAGSRRAAFKNAVENNNEMEKIDAKEAQTDYSVFTPDVVVDDKMNLQYTDNDNRSYNKSIQAKLQNYDEFHFKHRRPQ